MNILYFHQHFSTPKGSTGIRSYEMARALVNAGHSVTIVCGSYDGGKTGLTSNFVNGRRSGTSDNIKIIEYDLSYSNEQGFLKRTIVFLKYAIRSVFLVFSEKYDLVFATSTPLTAGIPGIFAKLLRRKKFVFEVRDLWPELPKAMGVITNPLILCAMSLLERITYNCADKIIGLAPGIVNGIQKKKKNRDDVVLIPNGCDLDIFAENVSYWRPDGIRGEDFLAVFTGTHGIANGLDAVIDACIELKKRLITNVKVVLIGNGKCKRELKNSAKMEGLDNLFFLDPVNKETLAALLNNSDIGLQILANIPAFYYGTSPNKFFDYIASGLPVLTNYPGWIADLINKNKIGYAVPPDEPMLLADTLILASRKKEQLKQMGLNAKKLAEKSFDRKVLSQLFVNVLTEEKRK